MLRPTLRAVLIGLALLPLAALPVLVDRALWTGWAVAAAGFAVLLALDALGAATPRSVATEVSAPDTLAIGSSDGALELRIVGSQRFAARLEGIVEADSILAPPPPFEVALPVGADLRVRVPLVAARRGTARIQTIWLRWQGPLRLLTWTVRRPLRLTIAAVPNIRPVRQLALRFASERDFRSGLKTERYEGDGTEFE
jgi:uncharacterized protein (DUF58 family)